MISKYPCFSQGSQTTERELGELEGRVGSCVFEGKESCWLGQEVEGGLVWPPREGQESTHSWLQMQCLSS